MVQYSTDRLATEKRAILNRLLCCLFSGLTITGNSIMKTIQLSQDKTALVSDEDYDKLKDLRWNADKIKGRWYVKRNLKIGKKYTTLTMHREIMGLKQGDKRQVDHRDGNGLNNQRYNLRICTQAENIQNQKPRIGYSSKYRGVCWDKYLGKWDCSISCNKKKYRVGWFISEIDAAIAYNKKAEELYGEFAYLNVIKGNVK